MKRFKKMIALLMAMSMLLSAAALTSCDALSSGSGSNKKDRDKDKDSDDDEDAVTEVVEDYLDALSDLSTKKMSKLVEEGESAIAENALSEEQGAVVEEILGNWEYEIGDVDIDDDEATVSVTITYADVYSIDGYDEMDLDDLLDEIEDADTEEYEIDIDLLMDDDEWLIASKSDSKLVKFVTGLGSDLDFSSKPTETVPTDYPSPTVTATPTTSPTPTKEPEVTATPTPTEKPEVTATPTATPKATATPTATPKPEATPIPTPVETKKSPLIYVYSDYYTPDDYVTGLSFSKVWLATDSYEDYPNLKDKLFAINEDYDKDAYIDQVRQFKDDFGFSSASVYHGVNVKRADSQVVSYLNTFEFYGYDSQAGSSMTIKHYSATNIDSNSGVSIKLSDVVKDTDALASKAYKDFEYMSSADDFKKAMESENFTWFIEPQGVTFLMDYDGNVQRTLILFKGNEDIFTGKYTASDRFAINENDFSEYETIVFDKENDGTIDTLDIDTETDEYGDIMAVKLILNGSKTYDLKDVWCYGYNTHIIMKDGSTYLYFSAYEEGYSNTYIFDITKGDFAFIEDVDAGFTGSPIWIDNPYKSEYNTNEKYCFAAPLVNVDDMYEHGTANLLGTYSYFDKVSINDAGIPECVKEYAYAAYNWSPLEVLIGFNAEDYLTTEDVFIPIGTQLTIRYLVPERNEVIMSPVDDYNTYYLVKVDQSDWPYKVDGMNEEAVFNGIMYAG